MRKPGKAEKWAARGERLSAALRENLKRRKAQARGRAAGFEPGLKQSGQERDDDSAAAPGREAKVPDFRRNRSND
jgi:hypothetical protein